MSITIQRVIMLWVVSANRSLNWQSSVSCRGNKQVTSNGILKVTASLLPIYTVDKTVTAKWNYCDWNFGPNDFSLALFQIFENWLFYSRSLSAWPHGITLPEIVFYFIGSSFVLWWTTHTQPRDAMDYEHTVWKSYGLSTQSGDQMDYVHSLEIR